MLGVAGLKLDKSWISPKHTSKFLLGSVSDSPTDLT